LSAVLIALNVFAFLCHTALYLNDELWIKEFNRIQNRIKFFNKLTGLLGNFIFYSFHHLFNKLNSLRGPPDLTKRSLLEEIKYLNGIINDLISNKGEEHIVNA
jgi:hypothetical protein